MKKPIGADVVYRWDDDPEAFRLGFISFADWSNSPTEDDENVFFYSNEEDFKLLLEPGNDARFLVVSYDYRYTNGGG